MTFFCILRLLARISNPITKTSNADLIMRIALLAISFHIITCALAADVLANVRPYAVTRTAQSKVSVRPEDLPEPVKSTLAGSYSEWKVTSAYLVTRDDNSQYYEINIKRSEETSTLNLDKYGKKVD